jgi:hypothetical protein
VSSGGEPALQGLLGPLDLPSGLWVAGGSGVLAPPKQRERVFERVAPAGQPGCVDAAVIPPLPMGGRPRARRFFRALAAFRGIALAGARRLLGRLAAAGAVDATL